MAISFDDIELAFDYVSSDQKFMNSAILCSETGEIFYVSGLFGPEDELSEDIEDPDKYISIPHKNDLGLGKALAIEFTSHYPKRWAGSTRFLAGKVRIQDIKSF